MSVALRKLHGGVLRRGGRVLRVRKRILRSKRPSGAGPESAVFWIFFCLRRNLPRKGILAPFFLVLICLTFETDLCIIFFEFKVKTFEFSFD